MLKNFIKGIFLNESAIKEMNKYPISYFAIIFIGTCFVFPAGLYIILKLVNIMSASWKEVVFIFLSMFIRKITLLILFFLLFILNKKLFRIDNIQTMTILKACIAVWFINPIILIFLELSSSSLINIPYTIYWFIFMKFYFEENSSEASKKVIKFLTVTYIFFFVLIIFTLKYLIYFPLLFAFWMI